MLSVRDGDRSLPIAVDSPAARLATDPFARLDRVSQLHSAANGKLLQAWMPLLEPEAMLARLPMPVITSQTITNRAALVQELIQVRNQGWAMNDHENHPDIQTVSVPVFDGLHRCVAALGLSDVAERIDPKQGLPVLLRESKDLTRRIAGADIP